MTTNTTLVYLPKSRVTALCYAYWATKFSLILIAILLTTTAFAQTANSGGVIKGVITSAQSKQPVAFARVVVTGHENIGTITDETGAYKIDNAPTGYQSLSVDNIGYQSIVTQTFQVKSSSDAVINIDMHEQPLELSDIVVKRSSYTTTTESPLSLSRINIEEIEKTPGGNRDISKVIQSMPGVLATPIQRNDLLVRGGGANENKYYLDGIEIPVLNHFAIQGGSGGNASLVNTDFLSNVDFYTSAFPSSFSNGISSVTDMHMGVGNSDKFKGKVTLGASDFGLSVDTPISVNGKTTLLASYRRSYLQLLFKALGLPFLPTYNDYQMKLTHKFNSRNMLSFIVLGSFDNNVLNTGIKEPDESQRYILGYLPENRQRSYVLGLSYKHTIEKGVVTVVASYNGFNNILEKYKNNEISLGQTMYMDSYESDTRVRAEIKKNLTNTMVLNAGAAIDRGEYNNITKRVRYTNDALKQDSYNSNISMARYGLFANLSDKFFKERLSVSAGIRLDGNSYSKQMSNPLNQFSPRLSASLRITPKVVINTVISRYYQEPSYTTLGYSDDNGLIINKENGLRYFSATHYVAGIQYTPTPQSKLSLEGFYKRYKNYPVSLIDSLPISTLGDEGFTIGDVPVKSVGEGRAYGGEISYRNSSLYNTVINVSYTLLYSEFKKPDKNLAPTNIYIPSSWDVRNIINIMAIHKFKYNIELGAKWRYMGGGPYSPYDNDISSSIDAWNTTLRPYIDYNRFNTLRGAPYHQLDIRFDKTWFFSKWTLGVYLDIQNVYNYKAKGQDILMPKIDINGAYIIDTNNPGHYVMESISNTLGGTVLPTFGLIIEF